MLFSHSPKAKLLWKEQTGRAVASYSATRWWSRWEVYHQLLLLFGDVELFLQRNDDVGAASRQKLLAIFQDPQKAALLIIELASIIDWGEAFVKSTYNLEGDGPLPFTCCEIVQAVVASIQVANTPNVNAVAKSLAHVPAVQQQLVAYAKSCLGWTIFSINFRPALKYPWLLFKAACSLARAKSLISNLLQKLIHYLLFLSFPLPMT